MTRSSYVLGREYYIGFRDPNSGSLGDDGAMNIMVMVRDLLIQ